MPTPWIVAGATLLAAPLLLLGAARLAATIPATRTPRTANLPARLWLLGTLSLIAASLHLIGSPNLHTSAILAGPLFALQPDEFPATAWLGLAAALLAALLSHPLWPCRATALLALTSAALWALSGLAILGIGC